MVEEPGPVNIRIHTRRSCTHMRTQTYTTAWGPCTWVICAVTDSKPALVVRVTCGGKKSDSAPARSSCDVYGGRGVNWGAKKKAFLPADRFVFFFSFEIGSRAWKARILTTELRAKWSKSLFFEKFYKTRIIFYSLAQHSQPSHTPPSRRALTPPCSTRHPH